MADESLLDKSLAKLGGLAKEAGSWLAQNVPLVSEVPNAIEEIDKEKARKAERAASAKTLEEQRKKRQEAINKQYVTYAEDLTKEGMDSLEINTVRFAMPTELTPPTAIRIDKQNINFKWQTLRTTASQKVTSGHANARITMALYFVGERAINTGLRRLIATFKALPFVFIENKFIRSNLSPNSPTTMACSLVNMTIRTEQNLPDTLVVDLDLQWFNYRPYSAGFWFRKDRVSIIDEETEATDSLLKPSPAASKAVYDTSASIAEGFFGSGTPLTPYKRDPMHQYAAVAFRPGQSKPLVDFVNRKMGDTYKGPSNAITFVFKDYKQIPGLATPDIIKKFASYRRGVLSTIDEGIYIERGRLRGANLKMRPEAANALKQAAKTFFKETNGKKLPINSCFRTYEEQENLYRKWVQCDKSKEDCIKASPPGNSWHEAGLAVDIDVERSGRTNTTGLTKEQWEKFKKITAGSFAPIAAWGDKECWHFNYTPGQGQFDNVAKAIDDIRIRKGLTSKELEEVKKATIAQRQERKKTIQEQSEKGYVLDPILSDSVCLYFYKAVELLVTERDKYLIPQGIAIAKHNMIANLPIVGHEFATQQYLGSTDMDAVIYFTAAGDTKLKELQSLVEKVQASARLGQKTRAYNVIKVKNSLFQFAGFDEALIDGITVQNIPGSPNQYSVTLQLTQHTRTKPTLKQERFIVGSGWKDAAEWVYSNLLLHMGKERIKSMSRAETKVYFELGTVHLLGSGYNLESLLGDTDSSFVSKYTETVRLGDYLNSMEAYDDNEAIRRYAKTLLAKGSPGLLTWMQKKQVPYVRWNGRNSDIAKALQGDKTDDFRNALILYSAVLLEASLRRIPTYVADRLGIRNALQGISEDALLSNDTEVNSTEEKFHIYLQKMLAAAYKIMFTASRLNSLSGLRDIMKAEQDFFERGCECYPDMDLPPTRSDDLISVLDTDPDFYFYNESIEGDLGFMTKRDEYIEKGKNIIANTLKSWNGNSITDGVISKRWYDNNVISPNKFDYNKKYDKEIEDNPGKDDAEEVRKRAAAFLDESILAHEASYKLEADKVQDILEGGRSYNKYTKDQAKVAVGGSVSFGPTRKKDDPKAITESQVEDRLNEGLEASCVAALEDNTYRMVRAFPTFKIYFVEDDSTTDTEFTKLKNFDDFYSSSAVKSIRVVRSRKIPADLCVITLTNINGELDTLAFANSSPGDIKSSRVTEHFDPMTVNTSSENPFSKLVIMEGSKIQVRLGYSNDPNKLETVFNGQVVEVGHTPESADLIQLVCQSYAVELEAEPKFEGKYENTQELLSCMMVSPELTHFGKWKRSGAFAPNEIRSAFSGERARGWLDERIQGLKERALRKWTFLNKPQDDNVFAPLKESYQELYGRFKNKMDTVGLSGLTGLLFGEEEMQYNFTQQEKKTVWDVFKEMELRHPGFISSPVPYEQRYTMFFGPPDHRYWSTPITREEEGDYGKVAAKVKAYIESKHIRDQIEREAHGAAVKSLEGHGGYASEESRVWREETAKRTEAKAKEIKEKMIKEYQEYLEWQTTGKYKRYKSFRNYFFVTSDNHIIANNITASSFGTFNAVDLGYDALTEMYGKEVKFGIYDWLKMKADDNISDRNTRVLLDKYVNCKGSYFARRYAVALLMRSLKDIYKGTLTITGNPKIKPYDVVYLYDTYRDMFGPVEVEQVTHTFSQETGFITEIKPDLMISHNNLTTQCTADAMWGVMTEHYAEAVSIAGGAAVTGTAAGLATVGGVLGVATGGVGLSLAVLGGYKLVQWTQERQPLVITPLTLGYKPFIAGLDGYKNDTIYTNFGGLWKSFTKDIEQGWDQFWKSDQLEDWFWEHASTKLGGYH